MWFSLALQLRFTDGRARELAAVVA